MPEKDGLREIILKFDSEHHSLVELEEAIRQWAIGKVLVANKNDHDGGNLYCKGFAEGTVFAIDTITQNLQEGE